MVRQVKNENIELAENGESQNQENSVYRTKLEAVMKKKGILQKVVAQKADIELYQISELCSGKRTNIMLDTAKRICRVVGCTLDEAFGD